MNPEGNMIPGDIATKYGWVCPKCGCVYAPFVPQCTSCGMAKTPKVETSPQWRKPLLTEAQERGE